MTLTNPDYEDALDGLPPDLVRVLRDQSIIVPQDQSVFDLIYTWRNAPCNTPSALTPDLRSHEPPRNSGEGTAVNGPMPLAGGDESQTHEHE